MPAPGIATSNPFAILNSKKAQTRDKEERKPAAPKKEETSKKPAKTGAADEKKKPEVKPVPGKVLSLADMQKAENEKRQAEKEKKKEDKVEQKAEKVQKAQTDRQDRSGKGHQVRKEGKGTGGWEDAAPAAETEEAAAHVEPKSPVTAEEALAAEEAAKALELEEKQMTLEEYLKVKAKETPAASFNIRQVDSAQFANLKRAVKTGGQVFKIDTKPTAAKPEQKEKAADKAPKEKVADKVTAKKEGMALSGFRMENPARQRPEGGRGGRGGRGRGLGKGRGGPAHHESAEGAAATPQIDSEEMFPSLGGRPAPAETAQ